MTVGSILDRSYCFHRFFLCQNQRGCSFGDTPPPVITLVRRFLDFARRVANEIWLLGQGGAFTLADPATRERRELPAAEGSQGRNRMTTLSPHDIRRLP
jgi:hypothetical protein